MKNLSKMLVVSFAALCVFAIARSPGVELHARLTGTGHGEAEWKTQDHGTRLRAKLDVSGEHLAASSNFTVTIGNNAPFTVTTDNSGEFESEQRFNSATRPTINVGDSVSVADGTNTIVLSGVFTRH